MLNNYYQLDQSNQLVKSVYNALKRHLYTQCQVKFACACTKLIPISHYKSYIYFYKTTTRLQLQIDYKSQSSTTLNRHCSSEFGYKTIHTSYIIDNIKISNDQMKNSKLYIANFKENLWNKLLLLIPIIPIKPIWPIRE